MKRYNIPIETKEKRLEKMLWKFPFSDNVEEMKEKRVDGERILELELLPDVIDRVLYMSHMIVITNKQLRKNLLNLEKIFPNYEKAQDAYIKNELNIGIAEILPVWKATEIKTVYENKVFG